MACVEMHGFETNDIRLEGLFAKTSAVAGSFVGTASLSQTQVRTGAWAVRCNPASGAQGYVTLTGDVTSWVHFGLYIASLPTADRSIFPGQSLGQYTLTLTSAGTLKVLDGGTLKGTSTTVLSTGRWYWIGCHYGGSASSVVLLQIDGVDQVSGTMTGPGTVWAVGCGGTEATAIDIYIDDVIADDAGFIPPSRVGLLVPTADSAVGTGWTLGTGTATGGNAWKAVSNRPPLGVADTAAGSDTKQIRNATANANSNYDAKMTTYAATSLTSNDAILAVLPVVVTAAPSATQPKAGSVGVVSNPAIANVNLGNGGTNQFYNGIAVAGTYSTGWAISNGTWTQSPASVTVTTAPVMRITQVTSSNRVAMVCFMGIGVAWTPGARGKISATLQAINRASSI